MAIVTNKSDRYLSQLMRGNIDFDNHNFKIMLMASGFTFDRAVHGTIGVAQSGELAAGHGYTTGGQALTGVTLTEDNTNHRCDVAWTNPEWTASGGDLGPTHSAIIYDDTISEKTVIGCVDFGQDALVSDGNKLRLENLIVRQS